MKKISIIILTLSLSLLLAACSSSHDLPPDTVLTDKQLQKIEENGLMVEDNKIVVKTDKALLDLEMEPAEMFTYEFGSAVDAGWGWREEGKGGVARYSWNDAVTTEGIILTKYRGDKSQLRIPNEIEGFPVIGIRALCFDIAEVTDVLFDDTLLFFEMNMRSKTKLPEKLVIPYGVTELCDDYLKNAKSNEHITDLVIPDTVRVINTGALVAGGGFNSLTSLIIPDSVIYIGRDAFSCPSLLKIEFPDSLMYVGSNALADTSWYKSQPDGVIYAGKVALWKGEVFDNVKMYAERELITSIELTDGTISIADDAFRYFTYLTNVAIPDSVVFIGFRAFGGCFSLDSVTLEKILSIDPHVLIDE